MITIKDIAREASVSVTTVSNVIHDKSSRVSPATVDRIRRIIEVHNYIPNMSARSLVNKSSKIIGVINHLIPEQRESFTRDPFHGAFIGGIERKLRDRGYFLLIRTVEDGDELSILSRNWNLDGLIFTGLFQDEFFDKLLSLNANTPIALIDSYINVNNDKIFNIGLEDYNGSYMATSHLIDNGHRQILFASPKIFREGVVAERYRGYCSAMEKAGLTVNPDNVYQQEITIEEGRELGLKLAERKDFTAVVATADILAAGIMIGLKERGVLIPEDISLVGFDDLTISRLTSPQLTTIHQDVEEKGVIAAEMMVNYLEAKTPMVRNIIMPVHLVERHSVKDIS